MPCSLHLQLVFSSHFFLRLSSRVSHRNNSIFKKNQFFFLTNALIPRFKHVEGQVKGMGIVFLAINILHEA